MVKPAIPPRLDESSLAVPITSKAIIVDWRGRYLLQLRDNAPGIALPSHWGMFGGTAEPGETPEQALIREIEEELGIKPRRFDWFTEAIFILPLPSGRVVHGVWYVMPVDEADVSAMTLGEGAGMAFHAVAEIMTLTKISPWDLNAALAHARRDTLLYPAEQR